jgi:hypothetical protein
MNRVKTAQSTFVTKSHHGTVCGDDYITRWIARICTGASYKQTLDTNGQLCLPTVCVIRREGTANSL